MKTTLSWPEMTPNQWDYVMQDGRRGVSLGEAQLLGQLCKEHAFERIQTQYSGREHKYIIARWGHANMVFMYDQDPELTAWWLNYVLGDANKDEGVQLLLLAEALKTISDEEKILLLSGQSQRPSYQKLFQFLQTGSYWSSLSLRWFGRHGSALQEAMRELGWNAADTPDMVEWQFFKMVDLKETYDGWLDLIPYAYSCVVANNIRKSLQGQKFGIAQREKTILPVLKEANPKDVALASHLHELSALSLAVEFTPNVLVPSLSQEENQALRCQAHMHLELVPLDEVIDQLIAGTFGEHGLEPDLALPPLDV